MKDVKKWNFFHAGYEVSGQCRKKYHKPLERFFPFFLFLFFFCIIAAIILHDTRSKNKCVIFEFIWFVEEIYLSLSITVIECDAGTFGYNCVNNCSGHCLNGSTCNKSSGKCERGCNPGYTNDDCSKGEFLYQCYFGLNIFNCIYNIIYIYIPRDRRKTHIVHKYNTHYSNCVWIPHHIVCVSL